jgi:hypothetical protein
MEKILEKFLLPRLYPTLESQKIIPDHQYGFRSHHSTMQQCHRIVGVISCSLELKHYCTAAFLGVDQVFVYVWLKGLLFKHKGIPPFTDYLILKSYLTDRFFQVSPNAFLSSVHPLLAGVPQGSILVPIL